MEWIASSLEDVKKFPQAVQRDIGFALFRVQFGDTPAKAKPLKAAIRRVRDSIGFYDGYIPGGLRGEDR